MAQQAATTARFAWRYALLAVGPGLAAMLADTDTASIMTSAQSGALWGYRMLLLQFLLVPPLYAAQELSGRMGLLTGRGLAELIRLHFGRRWTIFATGLLMVSCFGAIVTQMAGLAGVGAMLGFPPAAATLAATAFILLVILTGSYRSVERAVILLGLFQVIFLVAAWRAAPPAGDLLRDSRHIWSGENSYLILVAANIGTSIMPWGLFYQQGATVDKGAASGGLRLMRAETLTGAILCQVVTAAIILAAASARAGAPAPFDSIPDIATDLASVLGGSHALFWVILAITGSALIASTVVSLTAAWSLGEAAGLRHSLESHPFEARWFYSSFAILLMAAASVVILGFNPVRLAVSAGVCNALLLPVVLAFLFRLSRIAIPPEYRLTPAQSFFTAAMFLTVSVFSVLSSLIGILQ